MHSKQRQDGIATNRLEPADYVENFEDLHPPLAEHEALVASDRCYFCYDAPCVTACPTSIDIPMFIRQISTGNTTGAAKTIFDQNILGGMCARVCPTETLCEQACVREEAEGKPVLIGQLQRFATDAAMGEQRQFYQRAAPSGKTVAVVGAGPAGLACAHRLATYGHNVEMFEARPKPGGLNEYGIASYKTVDNFAQREVDYILGVGGINIQHRQRLGGNLQLADLAARFDAVFLSIGLGDVNQLDAAAGVDGVDDAVEFIAGLRQAENKAAVPVGRRVVVIGGGMTAIDAAVQSKLLGAEEVTICYRRGQDRMNASEFEQELAASKGVIIRCWLQPSEVGSASGRVNAIKLEYTAANGDGLAGTGSYLTLEADQILLAIGQKLDGDPLGALLDLDGGRVVVDAHGRTSMDRVWAGGDCTGDGEDLTVTAVAQGRDAAESIHSHLSSS